MAKAGRRARADFATADDDLRSAPVALLLGHPDRMIERLQWMTIRWISPALLWGTASVLFG